jgi:hypothetical protein
MQMHIYYRDDRLILVRKIVAVYCNRAEKMKSFHDESAEDVPIIKTLL